MSAFLTGFMGPITQKLDQLHQEEEGRNSELRKTYLKALSDPETAPAARERIIADLQKLYPHKQAKGVLGKVGEVFGHIGKLQGQAGAGGGAGAQGPPKSGAQVAMPSPPSSGTVQGPPSQGPPASTRQSALMSLAPTPDEVSQRAEQAEGRKQETERQKLEQQHQNKLEEIRETAKARGDKVIPTPITMPSGTGGEDPVLDEQGKPKAWTYQRVETQEGLRLIPLGEAIPKTSSARPTELSSRVVTKEHALELAKSEGKKFKRKDGSEIDPSKLPEGMGLSIIRNPAGADYYDEFDLHDVKTPVGGRLYVTDPYSVHKIPEGAGVDLGPTRTATTRSHEVTAMGPEGPVAQTLHGATVPATPGAVGRGGGTPAPGAVPRAPTAPGTAPAPQAAPPSGPPAPRPPSSGGGTRPLSAVTPGTWNQYQNVIRPVREFTTQVFGDPTRPDLKPLASYVDLADSKESVDRLGTALRLTLHGFESAAGGPSADVRAGPVGVSTGGLGTWISNKLNIPTAVADQQTKMIQEALGSLTPRETEYFDAVMSSFTTMVGLRSITRASAAQATVQAIEREMPIIGLNTKNRHQFIDQSRRALDIPQNAVKGIPKSFLGPELTSALDSALKSLDSASGKGGEDKEYQGHKYHRDKPGDPWKLVQ